MRIYLSKRESPIYMDINGFTKVCWIRGIITKIEEINI